MKKAVMFILIALLVKTSYSQLTETEASLRTQSADSVEGWKKGGSAFLNISQTSLTNWAAGGENTFSVNGLISLYMNYKKGNTVWDNSLDIGYGLLKQGTEKNAIKTDDKIDFLSKFGKKAYKNWYYAGMLNFKTQLTDGYNYPNDSIRISAFMAPAYLVTAIGLDYKPNDNVSVFIAPLTAKFTFVNDQTLADSGAFGVEPARFEGGAMIENGKKSRSEFGGYLRFIYKKELMKNVSFSTKVDLFSNYANNPQNIDINWETLIILQANKYLSASINTQLLYDDDILIEIDSDDDGIIDEKGPRTQFKEILAIGFTYTF